MNYNKHYFQEINSPEKAYWVGYIIGDGTVFTGRYNGKTVYRMLLECNYKDKELMYNFAKAIGLPPEKVRERKEHNSFTVVCSSKYMVEDLYSLGIPRKNKSQTARLIQFKDEELMRAQICGLFDADGYFQPHPTRKDGIRFGFVAGEKDILDQISNYFGYEGRYLYKQTRDRRVWWQFNKSLGSYNDWEFLYDFLYVKTKWPSLLRKRLFLENRLPKNT